jgi:hypothetical protein
MKTAPREAASLHFFAKASLKQGSSFFAPETMKFFNSELHGGFWELDQDLPHCGYFVTSEQYDENCERMFSVRFAKSPTNIDTVGDFQRFATYEEAKAHILEIMRNDMAGKGGWRD